MSDSYYEMWCECGTVFYGDDRSRGRRCAACRAKAAQSRPEPYQRPTAGDTGTLHCGGCDTDHKADTAFLFGRPCPLCGWELQLVQLSFAPLPPSPVGEYIAKLERDMLNNSAIPSVVLMGTPSTSGMYFNGSPTPDWRREYMGQWTSAELDAEERRQRLDDHINAVKYALGVDPAGARTRERLTTSLDALAPRVTEFWSPPRAAAASASAAKPHHLACPGCSQAVAFTVNDCVVHHAAEGRQCPWSGQQRASVEHEQRRMAASPKPPTLREWLGDRVSELGRWADVLREQPVSAGDVSAWKWEMFGSEWHLEYQSSAWRARLSRNTVRDAVTGDCDPWELDADTLQMALFSRHPDVAPEPKHAAFPWDPYPEVL
jgi:hypothetical protein